MRMQNFGFEASEKLKLLSKTEYKEQGTIFKEAGMLYSEYLEYMTLKHQQDNIDDYVVWQTGMNTDDDSDSENDGEKESEPCGACIALEGQIFHISEVPEQPHKNCKCGVIPLSLLIGFEKINERLKKLEAELKKAEKNYISSKYGSRTDPITGKTDFHEGTDFEVPKGTPLPSPLDGKVSRNDYTGGNGNRVAVVDEDGVEHHFYHMEEKSDLEKGDPVHQGDIVGNSGNTGRSTGAHLHYETRDTNSGKGYPDNVVEPSQEDLDYLNDYFSSYFG